MKKVILLLSFVLFLFSAEATSFANVLNYKTDIEYFTYKKLMKIDKIAVIVADKYDKETDVERKKVYKFLFLSLQDIGRQLILTTHILNNDFRSKEKSYATSLQQLEKLYDNLNTKVAFLVKLKALHQDKEWRNLHTTMIKELLFIVLKTQKLIQLLKTI